MKFVVTVGEEEYVVSFYFEDDLTIVNVADNVVGYVVATAHSVRASVDQYDVTTGCKIALERALKTSPVEFFDKQTRAEMWNKFWQAFRPELFLSDAAPSDRLVELERRIERLEAGVV